MRSSRLLRQAYTTIAQQRRASDKTLDHFGKVPFRETRRVVVTGIGLVTPLGLGVTKSWQRLLDGDCGIRALSATDLPREQRTAYDALPAKVAGIVCSQELLTWCEALGVDTKSWNSARFVQFALAAAAEALNDAKWQPTVQLDQERAGVAIGCGMSATADLALAGQLIGSGNVRKVSPFLVPRILANMAAGAVSMKYKLLGPNHSVSTACATGVHSIGDAFNFVRHGAADVMVAGGTEACIDAVSIAGFSRMRALETRFNDDPTRASRPFDAERGGFVIGEGAGVLVLEELRHAQARNVPVYAEVRGYGLSSDAHHITQPPPDARGAIAAMQRALSDSSVNIEAVKYVNAHATSTPLGDDVEARAISKVCNLTEAGASHGTEDSVAISSTKGATGHLLGAAGAVEAVFTVLALHHRQAPPNINLVRADPGVLGSALLANHSRPLPDGPLAAMSNSFGFGGTNASLLFVTPPQTG